MPDLEKFLKNRLSDAHSVAVLGIGSELRSDDIAGILAAGEFEKRLAKTRPSINSGRALSLPKGRKKTIFKVFFGSTAPENLTGEIKAFKPDHIIIIDTVDMNEKPGTVIAVPISEIASGVTFSTHKMPAKILADYFIKSLKCGITMIGIQPSSLEFGKPVSPSVRNSAKYVAGSIVAAVR